MTLPKLEALVTVPVGGWAVSVTVGVTTKTSTAPAGTYYLSSAGSGARSLLAELSYQLATDWTGIADFAAILEPTGKITIQTGGETFTLTWTSTALRDALGFTGTLTPADDSFTGTKQATPLWLPNRGASGRLASVLSLGAREDDQVVVRARSGKIGAVISNRYTVDRFVFRGLTKAKTWAADEATANESAESFWEDYLSAGASFRHYTDATIATSYLVGSTARQYLYAGGGFREGLRRLRDNTDVVWEWAYDCYLDV